MFDLTAEDITEGSLLRALVVLAIPLLVQNLVQVVQQIVDLFWVGRLSADAVAAVGLTFPLVGLLFAATVTAPYVGTQVLVSQRVGGDDQSGARRAAFTGLALATVLGIVVGVIVFVGVRPLVELITSTRPDSVAGEVPQLAATYFGVLALGVVFAGTSDAIEGAFVGRGDSRAALYISVASVVTNLVLDPILIFGAGPVPKLGIEGAALATVAAYAAGMVLAAGLALRGRAGGLYSRAAAGFDSEEYRTLLEIGLPASAQTAARQAARLAVVSIVFVAGGAAGLAAYIVGTRVTSVAFIPAFGFQQAAQNIVGQNLGAGRPERATRTTWLGAGLIAGGFVVLGVIQWLVPGPIATALAPTLGGDSLDLAVKFLRIVAYSYPAVGAVYLFKGGFNGARHTTTSLVASLAQYWGVQLPIAAVAVLGFEYGVVAVFWATTISSVLAAIGLGAYYYYSTADGMFKRAAEVATAD